MPAKALRRGFPATCNEAVIAGTKRPFRRHNLSRNDRLPRVRQKEGIMSHTLKTDLALFAAAFIAVAFVLGANASFADILGALLGAH